MIFMGAESGSDETLRRMDKGGTMSTEARSPSRTSWPRTASSRSFRSCSEVRPIQRGTWPNTIEFIKRVKRVNPEERDHHVHVHAGAARG